MARRKHIMVASHRTKIEVPLKQTLDHWLGQSKHWQALFAIIALTVMFLSTTERDYAVGAASNDKINHAIAFLALALTACIGWPKRVRSAVILVMGYGLLIEVIQSFLPYRQFSLLDWVADIVGAVLGMLVAAALMRNRRSSPP